LNIILVGSQTRLKPLGLGIRLHSHRKERNYETIRFTSAECYLHTDNYFTLLDSTSLYHGSTSFYLSLQNSTMALLHSTRLHRTLPWLYFNLLDST